MICGVISSHLHTFDWAARQFGPSKAEEWQLAYNIKANTKEEADFQLDDNKNFKLVFARHFSSSDTWATLVSECIKNIMGTRRNPIDENDDPEDFQDEEDQEQWRQTLIYIGGALNNKFHSL